MCKNIEVDGPIMTRHRELGRWKPKGLPAGAFPITFHDDFGAIHLALVVICDIVHAADGLHLLCADAVVLHCRYARAFKRHFSLCALLGVAPVGELPPVDVAHGASHESLSAGTLRLLQLADARSRERINPDTN